MKGSSERMRGKGEEEGKKRVGAEPWSTEGDDMVTQ